MREINRTIACGLIFSKDNKLLMGRKDPAKGGVYSDCWHIPGGGVDDGESLEETFKREMLEEIGIDVSQYKVEKIPDVNNGSSEKTLETGEKVLCHMEFNYFKVIINDKLAMDIKTKLDGDLVEVRWYSKDELLDVKQIPGGKNFFKKLGLVSNE